MCDFLLIHGGSHGAWCWESVVRALDRLGVKTHAIDLPGGGDDPTPRGRVTFDAYVSAVNGFIRSEDLQNVILVGHSLAGILLPEIAADNMARIRGAIFIAAFVLNAGERAIDLIAPDRIPDYYRLAAASPEGALMLDYPAARRRFFSDLDEAVARSAYSRLTPQPFAPYLEPARHAARSIAAISRYVVCRNDQNLPAAVCRGYAEKLGGTVEEIDAGHDVMLSRPNALASLLADSRR